MAFQSVQEIDEALRTGTVDQAEIELFYRRLADKQAEALAAEAESLRLVEVERLRLVSIQEAADKELAQALADEAKEAKLAEQEALNGTTEVPGLFTPAADAEERFVGQKSVADLTPEELAALESSYKAEALGITADAQVSTPEAVAAVEPK